MWIDGMEGILEEFADTSRFSVEDAFASMSDFVAKRTAQSRKDQKDYYERKRRDPVWVAADRARRQQYRKGRKTLTPQQRLVRKHRRAL